MNRIERTSNIELCDRDRQTTNLPLDHLDQVRDVMEVYQVVHVLVEILLLDSDKEEIGKDEDHY